MLNFFNKLNPIAFIISFCIGIFYCYIKAPSKKVIYRYPTPENSSKTIYHDNKNKCYKYIYNEVECPS